MDNNGTVRHYSGTAVYDNRTTGYQQELVPIMSAEALLGQIGGYGNGGQISDTIVIENYYGYLEYKYYEYQAPQIEFTLNGTTYACPYGITWGDYAYLDTTEYPASANADVRWLDSTDGTGMQLNVGGTWFFITHNDEFVDEDEEIIGRAVYDIYIPPIDETNPIGTWFFNEALTPYYTNTSGEIGLYETVYLNYDLAWSSDTYDSIYFEYTRATYDRMRYESATNSGFNLGYDFLNDTWGGYAQYGDEVRYIFINSIPDCENPYLEKFIAWLSTNAEKISNSTNTFSLEPTSTFSLPNEASSTAVDEDQWIEVERSESAEFVLYYPLLDTSGIRITNTPAYNAFYERYSMPNMVKFRNTMGIPIPSLEVDYTSWIGTAVGGFLNMELMPNFSLGGILAILIAFAITMLFLKFFAGG